MSQGNAKNATLSATTLVGDVIGTITNNTVAKIQNNNVAPQTLGPAQDGYALVWDNADGYFHAAPVALSTVGGDLTGTTTHATVVAIQGIPASATPPTTNQVLEYDGSSYVPAKIVDANVSNTAAIAVSKLAPGTSGQILQNNGTPSPTWHTVSGDVTLTNTGATTVAALQGTGVDTTVPIDGYVLTYKAGGLNKWTPEAITTGSVTLGGDVTGAASSNLVSKIQGTTVAGVTPVGPSILQYDGYSGTTNYPTSYVPTGAPNKIIYGQNSFSTSIVSCIDDTPVIQAWINANPNGGVLRLVNVVLKTALDFTPWTSKNNVLEFQGNNRCAMNKAEIEMVGNMTIQGVGGSSIGGLPIVGTQAHFGAVNSVNQGAQEPNNLVHDGYVGADASHWFTFKPTPNVHTVTDGYVGRVMAISSVTNPSWDGYYYAIASYGDVVRVVPLPGTNPSGINNATDFHWSISNGSGTLSGIAGNNYSFFGGPSAVLAVYQCKNLTSNSDKHWMSLTGASNFWFNHQLFRVVGMRLDDSGNPTIAFINSATVQAKGGLTLPDYGTGSNPATANITAYEAWSVIKMSGFCCTVKNMSSNFQVGPAFVIDGDRVSTQYQYIEGCMASGAGTFLAAPAHVPMIQDDCFFATVKDCTFNAINTNQNASILVTSTNGQDGGYSGLTVYDNILMYGTGVVMMDEGGTLPPFNLQFKNFNIDGVNGNYPGQSWFALFTFDGAGGENIFIENPSISDAGGTLYLIEGVFNTTTCNVTTSINGGGLGPNMATNSSITNINGNVQELNARNWSMVGNNGTADLQQFGIGDDFSPVVSLPFQIPIQDLRTLAAWQALPANQLGFATFSDVSSDGYALLGPDGSSGKMIRVLHSSYPGGAQVGTYTIANPQVGDVIIAFIRAQSADPAHPLQGGVNIQGIGFPNHTPTFNNIPQSIVPVFSASNVTQMYGGQWLDCCAYAEITGFAFAGGPSTSIYLSVGAYAFADTIVDPESIAMLYIPVGTHPNLSPQEIVRYYRKLRRQVTSVPVADVGIPTRTGLSWGKVARIGTDGYVTSDTSAHPIFTYAVPTSGVFNVNGSWTAIVPGHLTDGYASGGEFNVVGYNSAGTITTSGVNTHGSNYNCGVGGAAAATPITITTSTNTIKIAINSQYTLSTHWQITINQVNGI